MEVFLDAFFETSFNAMERDSLVDRRCRRELTSYLNTMIEGCAQGEEISSQKTCRRAILKILNYHEIEKNKNGKVCLMGKHHNILYIAAKLCFDWKLKDSPTVACVLEEIYNCDHSFEKIIMGAIFGVKMPHFFFGWKSDYKNQDENLRALVYFMDHSTEACSEFNFTGYSDELYDEEQKLRFVDLPLDCCARTTPLRLVVQAGIPDVLLILLRYGANPNPLDSHTTVIDGLLGVLTESNRVYQFQFVSCLKLLLRALVTIPIIKKYEWFSFTDMKLAFHTKFPHLIEDNLVPESRCGSTTPELKHLCRCAIRKRLNENYQLPVGIQELPLPEEMLRYIDLLGD